MKNKATFTAETDALYQLDFELGNLLALLKVLKNAEYDELPDGTANGAFEAVTQMVDRALAITNRWVLKNVNGMGGRNDDN